MDVRVLPVGDTALTLEAVDDDAPDLALRLVGVARKVLAEVDAGQLAGVTDVIPAFRALTVCFDPARVERAQLAAHLESRLREAPESAPAGRRWRFPVCYDPEVASDLAELAETLGLAAGEIAERHADPEYRVLVIGFVPGFPYLGPLPDRLRLPRRRTPHRRVPVGSVAIANQYTAIYPWESPGGWHLIGRTPLPLFDPAADPPSTLLAGDLVRFDPVPVARYLELRDAAGNGDLDLAGFVTESDA